MLNYAGTLIKFSKTREYSAARGRECSARACVRAHARTEEGEGEGEGE